MEKHSRRQGGEVMVNMYREALQQIVDNHEGCSLRGCIEPWSVRIARRALGLDENTGGPTTDCDEGGEA